MKKFIIMFEGRTGSSYLIQCLNNHSDVIAHMEVLGEMREKEDDSNSFASAQIDWVKEFFSAEYPDNIAAIGFKTKLWDVLNVKEFNQIITDLNIQIIYMTRHNLVKLALSHLNSRKYFLRTNDYNLVDEKDRLVPEPLDPEEFDVILKHRYERERIIKAWLEELNRPYFTIPYEYFLADEEGLKQTIFNYLDVPYARTKGTYIKATDDDLRLAIPNYDEVRKQYEGTMFEKMFD